MFGVDFGELVIIAIVVLIVFGPEKLPELMHNIGVIVGRLQRELMGVKKEFYNSFYTPATDVRSRLDAAAKDLVSIPEDISKKEEGSDTAKDLPNTPKG